jgi:hypothetical protein
MSTRSGGHVQGGAGVLAAAAIVFGLALPAGAAAKKIVFGSKLKAAATKAQAHPVDSAFWSLKLSGGGRPKAPASGQILRVRLKGCAEPGAGGAAPTTTVLFQDLRPAGGSRVTVEVTSSPFNLPVCGTGGAGSSTVSTFHPMNMCVRKGDYVDMTDIGGFGTPFPNGVPYRVFGRASGSSTGTFTGAGMLNNGSTVSGTSLGGTELLMQMQLGTDKDGTALCPGGTG